MVFATGIVELKVQTITVSKRTVIDIFGDTGGLIIDTGSTGPPPEF